MNDFPRVIAHRGYREHYPENTLPALEAAVRAGADGVELDIQFCSDATPIVIHDPELMRVSGRHGLLQELEPDELAKLSVHEPGRFQNRFRGTPPPTLRQAAERLAELGVAKVFVEIKTETLPQHDLPRRVQSVLEACEPLGERAVIISFADTVVREVRSLSELEVGWVVSRWDMDSMDRAEVMAPDYLFVDQAVLPPPPNPLWEGSWRWVVYEVNDPDAAREHGRRGIDFIETAAVEALVAARDG